MRRRELQGIPDRRDATRQQIQDLTEFAERIQRTLDVADRGFCAQRRIVEKLDLQVMLRAFEGRRDVRVIRLQDLDVFIHVPHVEGNAS